MTTHVTRSAVQRDGTSATPSSAKRSRAPYRQQLTAAGPGKPAAGSEARRLAAVILEVLAGMQTPAIGAQALGIRLPRYYFLEQRAIRGLVAACEPRSKGRTVSSDRQIARLERELAVCRRELGRQQALARAAQRVLGLKLAQPGVVANGKGATAGKKTRRRRPVVRALRAARVLKAGITTNPAGGEVQPPGSALPESDGGNLLPGKERSQLSDSGGQGG
jgi:hypothetical protein